MTSLGQRAEASAPRDVPQRRRELHALLDAVLERRLDQWSPSPESSTVDPHWAAALERLARVLALDWYGAAQRPEQLPPLSDPVAHWLVRATWAHGRAGAFVDIDLDPLPGVVEEVAALAETDDGLGRFVCYQLLEAALVSNDLVLAQRIAGSLDLTIWRQPGLLAREDGSGHRYRTVMLCCLVRLMASLGRIDEAMRLLDAVDDEPGPASALLHVEGTRCFVLGNRAEKASLAALARRLEHELPVPRDLIATRTYLLTAYGMAWTGEVGAAAPLVLLAGGGGDLAGLEMMDRALALEILSTAALAVDDLDSAEAWVSQVAPLHGSATSNSIASRVICRLELAHGRVDEAAAWGELSVTQARAAGRGLELTGSQLLLSRVRIAQTRPGEATRDLQATVEQAQAQGHLAAQRRAARELKQIGRRPAPVTGSGWHGLSPREQQVATLIAQGLTNRAIAERLFLSEHTVRIHVSRVLAAFGVASRTQVAALATRAETALPALTARQRTVAELVARGLTNTEIAGALRVSTHTVEKHVGDVLRRWSLTSRAGIAALVEQPPPDVSAE
ncbi:LuxR C-terminal-related transcriptional regulator [Nocardioides pacificus]